MEKKRGRPKKQVYPNQSELILQYQNAPIPVFFVGHQLEVTQANEYARTHYPSMVLPDGRVVTGKTSETLGAASALLLNALKAVGGIDHHFELISSQVLEPVCRLKTQYLGHKNPRLHTDEILIALASSATSNPLADKAMDQLALLRDCQAHISVVLSSVDMRLYKKLGLQVTCEPKYETKKLYHR